MGDTLRRMPIRRALSNSLPGQVLLGVLRLCFVEPRRNNTSSVRSQLRVGDGARDLAAGVLQRAFAKGQLTRHELDERLSLVLAARARNDLRPALEDLEEYQLVRSDPSMWRYWLD